MNILVLGAGTFGTAVANELSVNTENNVVLFSRNEQKVKEINTLNTNKICFPNKHLTKHLKASNSFDAYTSPSRRNWNKSTVSPDGLFAPTFCCGAATPVSVEGEKPSCPAR